MTEKEEMSMRDRNRDPSVIRETRCEGHKWWARGLRARAEPGGSGRLALLTKWRRCVVVHGMPVLDI